MRFYILSLKHTKPADELLSFFATQNAGYEFRLERLACYDREHVVSRLNYYFNPHHCLPVPAALVERLAKQVRHLGGVGSRRINPELPGTDRVVPWHPETMKRLTEAAEMQFRAERQATA